MSQFIGRLEVFEFATDRIWELLNTFRYDSDVAQRSWIVPKGFRTDFASVPRVPLAYWLTGGTGSDAAVIHDFLYQSHNVESKQVADRVFYEAMGVLGAPSWRRWIMYRAVKFLGQRAWDSGPARLAMQKPAVLVAMATLNRPQEYFA